MRIIVWSSDVGSSVPGREALQVEGQDVLLLAIAVEPSDALRQAHGIPRQVVIDQDVAAAMQVDAFAARLRGYEELAVLLEKLNGSQALIHVHRAIDHVDLVIAIALGKLLNDIGLRARKSTRLNSSH